MGYEVWFAIFVLEVLIIFVAYEVGYLVGENKTDKAYQEAIEMYELIDDMQQETILAYKEWVTALMKESEEVQDPERDDAK